MFYYGWIMVYFATYEKMNMLWHNIDFFNEIVFNNTFKCKCLKGY